MLWYVGSAQERLHMDPSKSLSEDTILDLLREILSDLTDRYPTEKLGFQRDWETCVSRYAKEGFGFLSTVLPSLGKEVDRSLETAILNVPRGFKLSPRTKLPELFGGLFRMVFDPSGSLLDCACPVALGHLRQVLFLGYRYELPFTDLQKEQVLRRFKDTEQEIAQWKPDDAISPYLKKAARLIAIVLKGFDPKDILPRHGPGAVATGERLDGKWEFHRLYDSIHQVYPYYEYFVVGGARELSDRIEWWQKLDRLQVGRAKVILVPKDSRGPRLISAEPLEYQYVQQGLGRALVSHLESHALSRGRVNFSDQTVNQRWALESSVHKVYSTIDLKDASDRVTCRLVDLLFPQEMMRALFATRTTSTVLPTGEVVELNKFAPMGSALCFPVEALVFWALSAAVVSIDGRVSLRQSARQCYVYGDDIIVPSMLCTDVQRLLEACALQVNRSKSYQVGNFRESCGVDAFKGVDVTPVKLRTVWSGDSRDASAYASFVSHANELGARGYENASAFLWSLLEKVYGPVPYGTTRASYPCKEVSDPVVAEARMLLDDRFKVRKNARLCRLEFSVKHLATSKLDSSLDGWPRCLRNICVSSEEDPSRVVVPRSTYIKYGWRPVH